MEQDVKQSPQSPYLDVMHAVAKPPLWWDELGVPRYVAFEPWLVPSASRFTMLSRSMDQLSPIRRTVVLAEYTCPQCTNKFLVGSSAAGDVILGCCAVDGIDSPERRSLFRPRVLQSWTRGETGGTWVRNDAKSGSFSTE